MGCPSFGGQRTFLAHRTEQVLRPSKSEGKLGYFVPGYLRGSGAGSRAGEARRSGPLTPLQSLIRCAGGPNEAILPHSACQANAFSAPVPFSNRSGSKAENSAGRNKQGQDKCRVLWKTEALELNTKVCGALGCNFKSVHCAKVQPKKRKQRMRLSVGQRPGFHLASPPSVFCRKWFLPSR